MRKKFEIGPDGRIEGLRVVGFHGEVDFTQTPARREPVFADADDRLIGLEEPERAEDGTSFQSVWGRVGARADSNSRAGIFTLLPRPHAAFWGSLVVVLGEAELSHATALVAAMPGEAGGRTKDFLAWLGSKTEAPGSLAAQRLGTGVVWYCGLEEASSIYRVISRVAEEHMLHSSNENDDPALYRSSWWLARSAMDDSDRYIAAVGLFLSNRRMADAYLKATFRKRSSDEIELALKHARGVFDERREDALRKAKSFEMLRADHVALAPQPIVGSPGLSRDPFARSRSGVRNMFVVSVPGRAA